MNIPIQKRIKIRTLFSGIGRKFLLYFIFFSVIPIIVISFLGYRISEKIVVNQNIRYLELQNELVQNRLSDFFRRAQLVISVQSQTNSPVYNWIQQRLRTPLRQNCEDSQSIRFFLEDNLKKYPSLSALALIDKSGAILCGTSAAFREIPDSVYQKLTGRNSFQVFERGINPFPNPVILVSSPIHPDTAVSRGFIVGIINNEQISRMIDYFSGKKQISQIAILSSGFRPLFYGGNEFSAEEADNLRKNHNLNEKHFSRSRDGKEILRVTNTFPMFNWHIVSEVTYQSAMAELIVLRNQAIFGVGALLVLLIGLAFYISQRISVPIRQLVYTAQDIGDGLLHTPIKVKTTDEIGLLAKELDDMRKNLLDYYDNLENKVEERTEELRRAQYQIIQQEKMASIGLLAAGIAHEIGNPLTSISSLTQLLKRRLKDDINVEYLTTIMKNIDRISRIVRELVDFSRPSNFESGPTDINEVARAAVGIVKYDKRSKNINFILDLDPELPHTVLVADQLLQVFINILFNAVDAMEGFGNDLSVKSMRKNNQIIIEIRDTGSGIPESEINKIFEPFYTTKEVGKGTGLGLSVSYGIIRNFGGDISVQSTAGKGSVFTIKLPVKKAQQKNGNGR